MIWVGLTGGIASGKSTAAKILRRLGYPVIDADEIARTVVEIGSEGLKMVVLAFGPEILLPDQSLDRKKLGERVFNHPQDLKTLESILHPLVKRETARQKKAEEEKGTAIAFYDVPLLFEKNMKSDFDFVLLISCSEETQKIRLKNRDHLGDAGIQARLKNQMPLSEKQKLADFVIDNEGSQSALEKSLQEACERIKKQC